MESKREKHEVGRRGRESSHNWITLTREAPVSSSWGPHVYPPASPGGINDSGLPSTESQNWGGIAEADMNPLIAVSTLFFLHTYVKKRYLCEVERGEGWKRKKKAKGNCGAWVYACGREKSRKEEYKERIKWPRSWSVEKASDCFFWIFASLSLPHYRFWSHTTRILAIINDRRINPIVLSLEFAPLWFLVKRSWRSDNDTELKTHTLAKATKHCSFKLISFIFVTKIASR